MDLFGNDLFEFVANIARPPAPVKHRTDAYTGPFPRKRHSHRCLACGGNAVACYKAGCTLASTLQQCRYCRPVDRRGL